MKERPIPFSGPMVRAIMEGCKTQTRRVVKWPNLAMCSHVDRVVTAPYYNHGRKGEFVPLNGQGGIAIFERSVPCPYGVPGDRLWVRETWWMHDDPNAFGPKVGNVIDHNGVYRIVGYHASMDFDSQRCAAEYGARKRSPIYMPRWASRITLEVVSVRVERLVDISDADARAEGYQTANEFLSAPWATSVGPNPWCWVVEFKKLEAP